MSCFLTCTGQEKAVVCYEAFRADKEKLFVVSWHKPLLYVSEFPSKNDMVIFRARRSLPPRHTGFITSTAIPSLGTYRQRFVNRRDVFGYITFLRGICDHDTLCGVYITPLKYKRILVLCPHQRHCKNNECVLESYCPLKYLPL